MKKLRVSVLNEDDTVYAENVQQLPEMMVLELGQIVLIAQQHNRTADIASVIPGVLSVGIDSVLHKYHAGAMKMHLSIMDSK